MSMIEVNNVSMRFNMAKEKHESLKEYFLAAVQGRLQFEEFYALRDVSLTVERGDFYGLVGLNGSGKSTLLKVISGVFKPSAGSVTVRGTIAPLIELGAGFDFDLTARENIFLNGTVLGMTPKYIREKFDEIVEQKCEKRMQELMGGGTTVILVSHSIEQIERMCNKVTWLEKGRVRMQGSCGAVCAAYKELNGHGPEAGA